MDRSPCASGRQLDGRCPISARWRTSRAASALFIRARELTTGAMHGAIVFRDFEPGSLSQDGYGAPLERVGGRRHPPPCHQRRAFDAADALEVARTALGADHDFDMVMVGALLLDGQILAIGLVAAAIASFEGEARRGIEDGERRQQQNDRFSHRFMSPGNGPKAAPVRPTPPKTPATSAPACRRSAP